MITDHSVGKHIEPEMQQTSSDDIYPWTTCSFQYIILKEGLVHFTTNTTSL